MFAGHIGTIYQAHNARYLGRGTARTLKLLADGRVFSDRTAQKIRTRERGWEYAAAQLEAAGASPAPRTGDLNAWLRSELAQLVRPMRHPGNLRYAWPLAKAAARILAPSQPYPKAATVGLS